MVLGGAAMLAACGEAAPPAAQPSATAPDSSMAAASASQIDPATCDQRPDFAVLRPDAAVQTCTSGKGPTPNRESGTVIYTTAGKPAEIVAWYREQARKFEMKDGIVAETPNPIYSAKDGTQRNFMVLTEPAGDRTKVTLNWGRDG
jgi:hypothetical protein